MITKTCSNCGKDIDSRGFNIHFRNCTKPEDGVSAKIDVVLSEPKEELKVEKTFRTLEEELIESEEKKRKEAEEHKKREEEFMEKEKKAESHVPYLKCPFCYNIQHETASREQGSAWCIGCGKAFLPEWK